MTPAQAEGARIKELREARSITQAQLAAYAGYSTVYVRQVEDGRRNLSEKARAALAKQLNTTPAELLQARGIIGGQDLDNARLRTVLQGLTLRQILLLKYGRKVARLAEAFNDIIATLQGRADDE